MSAIRAIERVKRPLIVLEVLAIVLFAGELLYLRSIGTYQPGPAAALAFLLPPLTITVCFFPLCYLAWFRGQDAPAVRLLKQGFFWLLAAVATFVWLGILMASVGPLGEA